MAQWDLIELQDLPSRDRIELAPPAGPTGTLNAPERPGWTIAARLVGDTVRFEDSFWATFRRGEGHDFRTCSHTHLSWCDLCGEFMWGIYKRSLRCINCSYTCHHRCRPFIQLDCEAAARRSDSGDVVETDTDVDASIEWKQQQRLSGAELQQRIKEYNAQINTNLYMSLNRNGSYTGFIKVQFQLVRPVSLPPPPPPPPPPHRPSPSSSSTQRGRRTSFYLPRDAVKQLHLSSRTRTREVIEALLTKFTVVDNPAKFALYERCERDGQVCVRKLGDDERPLLLRLCAGPSEKSLSFMLRENETGEVNWDAFSLPELRNFLRILQREEEDHARQIVRRYALARAKLKEALRSFSTPG